MAESILILGAGASGLAAAAYLTRQGRRVILLERQSRVGRKILSTGNGRCNCSNADMDSAHYGAASSFVKEVYAVTPPEEVISFLGSLGLLFARENGRLYPRTMSAASVLDALRTSLVFPNTRVITDAEVTALWTSGGAWVARTTDKMQFVSPIVLCCLGGSAAPKLGTDGAGVRLMHALGHNIRPTCPALVQLCCSHPALASLKGLRAHAAPALYIDGGLAAREEGELLFTDYGVSGVCILQLSGRASRALAEGRSVRLEIDLLPEISTAESPAWLKRRIAAMMGSDTPALFIGVFQRMLSLAILREALIPMSRRGCELTSLDHMRLLGAIHGFKLPVTGTLGLEHAQVTSGGVVTAEVDPRTMRSRLLTNLFIAGETLDVDGPCGGYNLHFAFASGLTAAKAMSRVHPV